jgi:choline dehydrogenase
VAIGRRHDAVACVQADLWDFPVKNTNFDFIVVGAGSSGCVTAHALVKEYGARVLLLERGKASRDMLLRMPAGSFKIMNGRSPYLTRYMSTPQPTLDGRAVTIPQANVVGGGSAVNMMAYTRGSRRDYEKWDSVSGHAGWRWEDLLPHFRKQEGNQRYDNEVHGADGPMKVSEPRYIVEMTHLFVRTMQRLGIPFRADLHDGELGGVGFVQTTTFSGQRCSAADAFLTPLLDDPKLTLITGVVVSRVLMEGRRAAGVEYIRDGKIETARALSEVILTSGAIVTPKLLLLSGIGPAKELSKHGIPTKVDLPGVGSGLQDHVVVALTATTAPGLGYSGEERGARMVLNGLRYLLFRDGPVASNGSESMAYAKMDQTEDDPDLQIYCVPILSPHIRDAGRTHGITMLANLLRPRSSGSVSLRSTNPYDDPVIDPNWLSDPRDLPILVEGIRYMRAILQSAPLSSIVRKELFPGPQVQSVEELSGIVKATAATNYHPAGTCRMGIDSDAMSVLTPDLRVKGVDALRVFDASMMPSIVSTNLNATVMAVASKGVALMMGARSQKSATS